MNTKIYHITTEESWEQAKVNGFYQDESLAREGFIHCSTAAQVSGVLERYFLGKIHLVKLEIDPKKLLNELRYELSPTINQRFPHIFGSINLDAVSAVENIINN